MYGASQPVTPPRPPPRSVKPDWAVAFKRRREEKVGSQEELAIQADVSQSLISQIERGVQHPTGVSVERFARLLAALQWTVDSFSEATGISIPTAELSPRRGPPIPPVVEPVHVTHPIPPALQEVIDQYGETFPELHDETTLRAMIPPRLWNGPEDHAQTPAQWLDWFLMNRKFWPQEKS